MKRMLFSALAAMTLFGSAVASDQIDCEGDDLGARLVACTRLIESGKLADNDLANAHNNRGMGHVMLGDLDRGVKDFDRALVIDATLAVAYLNRGYAHTFKQNLTAAEQDFKRAMKAKPNWPDPYVGRSLARLLSGELDAAALDLTTAIRIDPDNAQNYVSRGGIYRRQGKNSEAIADFEAALKIDPHVDYAREHLRELRGDPDAWEMQSRGWPYGSAGLPSHPSSGLDRSVVRCMLRSQLTSGNGQLCLYGRRYASDNPSR